jgi:tetratricopeptide (TPR) repeat protein
LQLLSPSSHTSDETGLNNTVHSVLPNQLINKGREFVGVGDEPSRRDPAVVTQLNPNVSQEFGRILEKALEKDRSLRYQTANDLKTDLARLKRDLESSHRVADSGTSRAAGEQLERFVAVLYFENISDVWPEDLLSPNGAGLPRQAGHPGADREQLKAAYVLGGSLRRSGNRLRINVQLIDTGTDFPLWSERYDREMKDVFEVQDEIARKIAQALRITLSPQEQEALAAKPTENLEAYDLYLRGKSYARRLTRQDLEFALQIFENAVAQDPTSALAHAAFANVCAEFHYHYQRDTTWMERAMMASQKAVALNPDLPEVQVANAWILYASAEYDHAVMCSQQSDRAQARHGGRLLHSPAYAVRCGEISGSGRYRRTGGGGKRHRLQRVCAHPELSGGAGQGRSAAHVPAAVDSRPGEPPEARPGGRAGACWRWTTHAWIGLKMLCLRPAWRWLCVPMMLPVLYNAACNYCVLKRKPEALEAIKKAAAAGTETHAGHAVIQI